MSDNYDQPEAHELDIEQCIQDAINSTESYYFKVKGTDTRCTANALLDLNAHFANESKTILRIATGIAMLKGKQCITAGDIRQAIVMKASGVHHYLPAEIEE